MLDKIIKFSLHNRLLILVGAVVLVLMGLYSVHRTEVDVFPDLNAPTVLGNDSETVKSFSETIWRAR